MDLNLDQFSLDKEERFVGRLPPCSGGAGSLEARVALGKAFLEALRGSWPGLKADDKALLENIFQVEQCDRLQEGLAFIPPDPPRGARKPLAFKGEEFRWAKC